MNATDAIALELLIDRNGLSDLLHAIAEIATAKAEHVRTNWQDEATASHWDKAATLAGLTADGIGF